MVYCAYAERFIKTEGGCAFWYELFDGENTFGGGMTEEGELFCDAACTQKELMLRTLVFRCMNEGVTAVYARDGWGPDLTRFGFVRNRGAVRGDGGEPAPAARLRISGRILAKARGLW